MIPLKDRNPTRHFPYVNIALIGLNILAFLWELSAAQNLPSLFEQYAVIPARITFSWESGIGVMPALATFFSAMFLHGGWLHLLGNMLYLWVFGDNVEDKLGHVRYVVFYFVCGIAATLVHVVIEPGSGVPTVGASGAISGVLAAYLLLFPRARVVTLIPVFIFLQVAELPALIVLGFWFVLQFFNGLLSLGMNTAGMGGVAWWAHIGGFAAGFLLVIPLRKYR
ncbi:MAG: rhomboid family intramembrane serine protease [Ignavibacteria bacterium GWA2_55_11]|nr:MAG: rhomboid family intramembrane serine protease [Ignavibacteria bacterium GWA2_55_11]OGU47590.1 MAG: rhomboid family intramembrane serine protease [Ignavibacteria bacterium GWC2_56_12]OGU62134.1 MAG: rhomboid family intramembrane serine protease [Ignavibacteria bacterium RIFCSPHIGHO2_02_FULL_56_12]OGU70622.1 MAG: rhomboid family intramembrane serine protease [Ignavibacteria bacterium RIFCSPLOWO2_02_FULL_55_14]OGU73377.1 MAG: rhomboid family intramembrane serine protease [Ignavibacteria ba